MTSVAWQHGQVTSSSDLSRAITFPPSAPARPGFWNCIFNSNGVPSGRFAVSVSSVTWMRR